MYTGGMLFKSAEVWNRSRASLLSEGHGEIPGIAEEQPIHAVLFVGLLKVLLLVKAGRLIKAQLCEGAVQQRAVVFVDDLLPQSTCSDYMLLLSSIDTCKLAKIRAEGIMLKDMAP